MPEKPRPTILVQLLTATQTLKLEPVITLATALEQLGTLHPREIQMLADEDPQLLRSRSSELVDRLPMTNEDLHHALARTAGIVEVDAAHFMLPQRAPGLGRPRRDCHAPRTHGPPGANEGARTRHAPGVPGLLVMKPRQTQAQAGFKPCAGLLIAICLQSIGKLLL